MDHVNIFLIIAFVLFIYVIGFTGQFIVTHAEVITGLVLIIIAMTIHRRTMRARIHEIDDDDDDDDVITDQ